MFFQSLETFYTLLEDAENKAKGSVSSSSSSHHRRRDYDDDRGGRFKRPSRYSDSDEERSSSNRDRDRDGDRYSSRNNNSRHHHRDRDRDSERSWRKPGSERKREDTKQHEIHSSSSTNQNQSLINTNKKPETVIRMPEPADAMEEDDEEQTTEEGENKPAVLTDMEMNELNAKIFKAELLGDSVCLDNYFT
jgi:hypothetical protein